MAAPQLSLRQQSVHFYSIGFFGGPNIGDELLSASIARELREKWPTCALSIMTANAGVSETYTGLKADFVEGFAPTPEYLSHLFQHLRAASAADLVVIGGGGLLADRYSWAGLARYAIDAAWAVALGGRFVLVGVGALEIRRAWLRPIARFLCAKATAVSCRDEDSARRVEDYGNRRDVLVGPDLAHIMAPRLLSNTPARNIALVSVREAPPISPEVLEGLCTELLRGVDGVELLVAEPTEAAYLDGLVAGWSPEVRSRAAIRDPASLQEAVQLIESARIVVAERFHVNLIAAHAARRLVSLVYEEKVANLVEEFGPGHLKCEIDAVDPDLARAALELEEPGRGPSLQRSSQDAATSFHRVVEAGLRAPPPKSMVRLASALIAMLILGVTCLWAPLVAIKRILFGRGSFNVRNICRQQRQSPTDPTSANRSDR
jgi:polysaccharide pyruvyl transferase WcaK-like protein